jgi:hypothetical protein
VISLVYNHNLGKRHGCERCGKRGIIVGNFKHKYVSLSKIDDNKKSTENN